MLDTPRYTRLLTLLKFVFDGLSADFPLHFDLDFTRLPPKRTLAPKILQTIENALIKIKAVQGVTAAYSGDYKHKNEMFRLVWALSYSWAELKPLLDELAQDISAKPVQSSLDSADALKVFLEQLKAFPAQPAALPAHLIMLFKECFSGQSVSALWDPASHLRATPLAPHLTPDTAPPTPMTPVMLESVTPSSEALELAAELEEYATRRITNAYGINRHHIDQASQLARGLRDGGITIEALRECVPQLLAEADPTGEFYRILSKLRPDWKKDSDTVVAAAADSVPQTASAGMLSFFWRGRSAAQQQPQPPQQPAHAAVSMALGGGQ